MTCGWRRRAGSSRHSPHCHRRIRFCWSVARHDMPRSPMPNSKSLLQMLATRAQADGGSFSVVASRRTPPPWRDAMHAFRPSAGPALARRARWRQSLCGIAGPCRPHRLHAGLGQHAQRSRGDPCARVFAWKPHVVQRTTTPIHRYAAGTRSHPRARAGQCEDTFDAEPLRETARVAAAIRRHLDLPD